MNLQKTKKGPPDLFVVCLATKKADTLHSLQSVGFFLLSDIHNSCFQHTFVKIIGTAFAIQIQVHIRQIIFIDDPCHVDLNTLARFQRRNIITTIPIIFSHTTVSAVCATPSQLTRSYPLPDCSIAL